MGTQAPRRVLVIPDPHVGVEDSAAVDAMWKYASMGDKIDLTIVLGDLLDFDEISFFSRGNKMVVREDAIPRQFEKGREFLKTTREVTGGAPTIYLEGNHEARLARYFEQAPEARSLLSIEKNLDLEALDTTYLFSWTRGEILTLGSANFIHGQYTNKYHAFKHVSLYGTNIFYGHTHDVQSYALERPGDHLPLVGQSFGTLRQLDASYTRSGPTRWQQAFGEFWILPDGRFQYYVHRIFDGRVITPSGEIVQGFAND